MGNVVIQHPKNGCPKRPVCLRHPFGGPHGFGPDSGKRKGAANNLKRDYNGNLILTIEKITPEIIDLARRGRPLYVI
jgi:hypothetical protein